MTTPLALSPDAQDLLFRNARTANAFSDEQFVLMQSLADSAAVAIRNAALYANERRRRNLADTLREVSANDLAALVATLPALRAIGFNGGAAHTHGMRQLGDAAGRLASHALPSSSPMHTVGFDAKRDRWQAMATHLA